MIHTEPLTEEQRKTIQLSNRILDTPLHYHLIDIFKQLKFGRPSENQKFLEKCIKELEEDLDKGKPFS